LPRQPVELAGGGAAETDGRDLHGSGQVSGDSGEQAEATALLVRAVRVGLEGEGAGLLLVPRLRGAALRRRGVDMRNNNQQVRLR